MHLCLYEMQCVCVNEREKEREECVVYFNQFLGAARTQKLVELLFFTRIQTFLFISNQDLFFLVFLEDGFGVWTHNLPISILLEIVRVLTSPTTPKNVNILTHIILGS